MGMNHIDFRLKTQTNRKCQLFTFMIERLPLQIPQILGSSDDRLSNLQVKTEDTFLKLTPEFDPTWPVYTVSVYHEIERVQIIATTINAGARIKIGQCGWQSEKPSPYLYILQGSNTINVVVTPENGAIPQNYIINVRRSRIGFQGRDSSGAITQTSLRKLELSLPGQRKERLPLIQDTVFYQYNVDNSIEYAFLTPETEDPGNVVEINGDSTYNGHEEDERYLKPIQPITLLPGKNKIRVLVSNPATFKEYVLVVFREYEESKKTASSESRLTEIEVGPYSLIPGQPHWKKYEIHPIKSSDDSFEQTSVFVDGNADYFLIRPWAVHDSAVISVEGNTVLSGNESPKIPVPWSKLRLEEHDRERYWITVTADDKKTTTIYEVKIKKKCPRGQLYSELRDLCEDCKRLFTLGEGLKWNVDQNAKDEYLKKCDTFVCERKGASIEYTCENCKLFSEIVCETNNIQCVALDENSQSKCIPKP
eukprot:c21767_g1_i1.p2 GENE.c21767_g1_i1~~c21767_g1_i1.p2  ORF type:complete len:479 (-),score=177.35 c21767_g1_i1:81-1517(-)